MPKLNTNDKESSNSKTDAPRTSDNDPITTRGGQGSANIQTNMNPPHDSDPDLDFETEADLLNDKARGDSTEQPDDATLRRYRSIYSTKMTGSPISKRSSPRTKSPASHRPDQPHDRGLPTGSRSNLRSPTRTLHSTNFSCGSQRHTTSHTNCPMTARCPCGKSYSTSAESKNSDSNRSTLIATGISRLCASEPIQSARPNHTKTPGPPRSEREEESSTQQKKSTDRRQRFQRPPRQTRSKPKSTPNSPLSAARD